MNRKYGLLLTACMLTLGTTPVLQAATPCKQFSFIYQSSFVLGDGEGMETHSCKESNYAVGDATFKKMQGMVNANQPDQARKELDRVLAVNHEVEYRYYKPNAELCVRPAQAKAFENLMQQIGQKKTAALERSNKYQDAIETSINYCLDDDAARIHLMLAEKNVGDTRALKSAYSFGKRYNNKTYHDKLLAIAGKQSKNHIDSENRFFTATAYNPMLLDQAVAILESVDDKAGMNRVVKLAESRGDELIKFDSCRMLNFASEYYKTARHETKLKALRAKASRMAAAMEKQNTRAAAECYELAGDESRAEKMHQATADREQQAEAAMQKNEPARKAKFDKEQQDLEKELGL